MIPNINDSSQRSPRLRLDLNLGTLIELPPWSSAPGNTVGEIIGQLGGTPYEGIQTGDPRSTKTAKLPMTGTARLYEASQIFETARTHREEGADATTVILGSGVEDDGEAATLAEAFVDASVRLSYPLFLETHRGTITQDLRRTLDLVRRFPDLRFNGDFSHWYTGHAMAHERFEEKLALLAPVFARTRFLHGRIGTTGSMQVAVAEGAEDEHVLHFKEFWTRSFAGFLRSAKPGDVMVFAPELLPARLTLHGRPINVNYARFFESAGGGLREETDRWQQALILCRLAETCFIEALTTVHSD